MHSGSLLNLSGSWLRAAETTVCRKAGRGAGVSEVGESLQRKRS